MKKLLCLLVAVSIMSASIATIRADENASATNVYRAFYVSLDGNDDGDGSKGDPFRTIARAQQEVRKINQTMEGDIVINIAGGRYELHDSIKLDELDSGYNGYNVIYRGDRDNIPTFSGAKRIEGFQPDANGLWSVYVPDVKYIRELFINDKIAQRARSQKKFYGNGYYKDDDDTYAVDGMYVDKADIGIYDQMEDVEFIWSVCWKSIVMHVKDLRQDPENENQVIVEFPNPVWDVEYERNMDTSLAPTFAGWHVGFLVENAFELLDEPGEFYYNKQTKMLYYMPREGEDMETAEVLCAVTDKLLEAKGSGYDRKLKNVIFEDIRFAHSTWAIVDEYCFKSNQLEAAQMTCVAGKRTPGTVELSYADQVAIRSCVFYGTTLIGLSLHESVTNSVFEGNVFTDIGSGAFCIGEKWHDRWIEPTDLNRAANVFFRKPWTASYQTEHAFMFLNPDHYNDLYWEKSVWKSEPGDEARGVKSWVKADLMKGYNIDSIKISFKDVTEEYLDCRSGTLSDVEKSNYEVLLSNDYDFHEYEVLATITAPQEVVELKVPQNEKYRYVMLRKTKAEPFAISGLWIFSYDEKADYGRGLCINNKFSNNYITRTGRYSRGAPSVTAVYTEKFIADHNEIYDVPYTGISVGWGFLQESETAKDNIISNNLIDGFTLQANDSSAIYLTGNQPNTEIYGNYMKNQGNKYAAFYPDGGSRWYRVYNNVAENTAAAIFIYQDLIFDLKSWDNYGTSTIQPYSGTRCEVGEIGLILPNRYTKEAITIAMNAGLEDAYAYIRERVMSNETNYYSGPYSVYSFEKKPVKDQASPDRMDFYVDTVENILKYGRFGNQPWNYDLSLKYELQENVKRIADMGDKKVDYSTGHIDEQFYLRNSLEQAIDSFEHLPLEEMKAICERLIAESKEEQAFGGYQKGAIDQLKKGYAKVLEMPCVTEPEKYMVVLALEDLVDEFAQKKYDDEILYLYIPDAETSVDAANKKITVKVPLGTDVTKLNPIVETVGNTKLSVDFSKIHPYKEITIPIYNSDIKKYSMWSLLVTELGDGKVAEEITVAPADWYSNNDNTKFICTTQNELQIQPWVYPYMYKTPLKGKIAINVEAEYPDVKSGISFIVGAKSCETLEYDQLRYKNTYYKISLKGQEIELYKVVSGLDQLVTKVSDVGFVYGEKNKLAFDVHTDGNYDNVRVWINDRDVVNAVTAGIGDAGYFGVLTECAKIKLSEVH